MTAGLQVFNDNNIIQIDQDTPCMAIRYHGSSTLNAEHPIMAEVPTAVPGRLRYRDITVTGASPIMGVVGNTCMGIISVRNTGSTWTFRVAGMYERDHDFGDGTHDLNFEYYVWDRPLAQDHGSGLELYDANGDATFSNSQNVLEVRSFINQALYSSSDIAYADLPRNRKWAVISNACIDIPYSSESGDFGQTITSYEYRLFAPWKSALNSTTNRYRLSIYTFYSSSTVHYGDWVPWASTDDLGSRGTAGTVLFADVTAIA